MSQEIRYAVLTSLSILPYFHQLEMKNIIITNEFLELLGVLLKQCPSIQLLCMSNCTFQNNFAEELGKALAHGSNLRELELSQTARLDDRAIRSWQWLAPQFGSKLRVLRLNACNLTTHGLDSLANTMLMTKKSSATESSIRPLQELDLSDNPLGDVTSQSLSLLLSSSPKLKVLRMARCGSSLDWLPGTLTRSCQATLKMLDISGNTFSRSTNVEWSVFFSGTTALETLKLDNCQGLYFAETLKLILSGLGRLKRRPTEHCLSVHLSQLKLGNAFHPALSTTLSVAVNATITHLNLSNFDFAEAAPSVFRTLESCVNLEGLIVDGPWTVGDTNFRQAIVLSISHLLKKPNCRVSHLSLANVGLENDVLYLIDDLLNFPSLRHLDISGNRFVTSSGDPVVPQILARVLAATDQLTYLAFDNNDLSLQHIEQLVHVAENYRGSLILGVPILDLARTVQTNPAPCQQLIERIQNLHKQKPRIPTRRFWKAWEQSEKMQATIQCVDRLCTNTRQLTEEAHKLDLGDKLDPTVKEDTRQWLADGLRTPTLLHEFSTTAWNVNREFLERLTQKMADQIRMEMEGHLEKLALTLQEKAVQFCPHRTDTNLITGPDLAQNLHSPSTTDLVKMINAKVMPELESMLNTISMKLTTDIFDMFAGDLIDGLDQSHQALVNQLRLESLEQPIRMRKPVRKQWMEAREEKDNPPCSYPIVAYLGQSIVENGGTTTVPQSLLTIIQSLRFCGLEDCKPCLKSSPTTKENTAASTTGSCGSNLFPECQAFVKKAPSRKTSPTRNLSLGGCENLTITTEDASKRRILNGEPRKMLTCTDEQMTKPWMSNTTNHAPVTKAKSVIYLDQDRLNDRIYLQPRSPLENFWTTEPTVHLTNSPRAVDSFCLEPLLPRLVPVEMLPTRTNLSVPRIQLSTPLRNDTCSIQHDLIHSAASYRTTMYSDVHPSRYADGDFQREITLETPRRRKSEPNLWWEESLMNELCYVPCKVDISESGNGREVQITTAHAKSDTAQNSPLNETDKSYGSITEVKPRSSINVNGNEPPASVQTSIERREHSDHRLVSNCQRSYPEDNSSMNYHQQLEVPGWQPQRQRASRSKSCHGTRLEKGSVSQSSNEMLKTIILPDLKVSNEKSKCNEAPVDKSKSQETYSINFARLKLFFEENSSPRQKTADIPGPREKPTINAPVSPASRQRISASNGKPEATSTVPINSAGSVKAVEFKRNPILSTPAKPASVSHQQKPPEQPQLQQQAQTHQQQHPKTRPSPAPLQPVVGVTELNVSFKDNSNVATEEPTSVNSSDTIRTRDTSVLSQPYMETLASSGSKLSHIALTRPKRQKTRSSRNVIPGPAQPTDASVSMEDDLFRPVKTSWSAASNGALPTLNEEKSIRVSQDYNTKSGPPDHSNSAPSQAPPFELLTNVHQTDADTEMDGHKSFRLRGVPMPGLVGPKAQNFLAEIKQKNQLRSHELKPAPKPVEQTTPVTELQRARSALRSAKPSLRSRESEREATPTVPLVPLKPVIKRT